MRGEAIPEFVAVGVPQENVETLLRLVGQRLRQKQDTNTDTSLGTRQGATSDQDRLIICASGTCEGFSIAEYTDSIGIFEVAENQKIDLLVDQIVDLLHSRNWFASFSSSHIYKSPFVKKLSQKIANEHNINETDQKLMWTAIEEAVSNGVVHGNLELKSPPIGNIDDFVSFYAKIDEQLKIYKFGSRRITVQTWTDSNDLWISVTDEGLGYEPFTEKRTKNITLTEGAPRKERRHYGRGMEIIRSLTKEIQIERRGRRLAMRF